MHKILALTVLALMFASGCVDGPPVSQSDKPKLGGGTVQDATIFNQPGVFYRVEASYEYLPTGEIIAFDYVASCFNREVRGSFAGELLPLAMYKPTSTGGAIGINTIPLCAAGVKFPVAGVFPEKGGVPHPFTMVFPDVNDLFQGWGYANHYAYESERAEIRFITGKITKTDRAAFMKWYDEAPLNYKQIGALPGPHGHQTNPPGEQLALNNGNPYAGQKMCSGYTRIPLSDKITQRVREIAPTNVERYWTRWAMDRDMATLGWDDEREEQAKDLYHDITKIFSNVDGLGNPLGHYKHMGRIGGTLQRDGTGTKHSAEKKFKLIAPEIYPYFNPLNNRWPDGVEPVPGLFAATILPDESYKGFLWCGWPSNSAYRAAYQPSAPDWGGGRMRSKRIRYFIGSDPVFVRDVQGAMPRTIFDNEGYLLLRGSMGISAQSHQVMQVLKRRMRTEGIE